MSHLCGRTIELSNREDNNNYRIMKCVQMYNDFDKIVFDVQ